MTPDSTCFSAGALKIDCEKETRSITEEMRRLLASFRRRGLVVALSGGIDSSVTAALCVRAVGRERVFGLHMPDRDSATDTLSLSRSVSDHFQFGSAVEDMTPILEAVGCYRRQEEAIRKLIPEYGVGWKSKIVLESLHDKRGFSYFNVVARAPDGTLRKARLPLEPYLGIVAATNFKQRARKMLEYYHADRLNYAVTGTPNRLEYDQGFFVKLGDGAADIKPIAHLYKTQVYQMAEFLGVPECVQCRPPTTDTYSLPQGQDEFYFAVPYEKMDLCLYGKNHRISANAVAEAANLTPDMVEKIWLDIEQKRKTTRYLHLPPALAGPVEEIKLKEVASQPKN
jgi:NAD+ synthase